MGILDLEQERERLLAKRGGAADVGQRNFVPFGIDGGRRRDFTCVVGSGDADSLDPYLFGIDDFEQRIARGNDLPRSNVGDGYDAGNGRLQF